MTARIDKTLSVVDREQRKPKKFGEYLREQRITGERDRIRIACERIVMMMGITPEEMAASAVASAIDNVRR